MPIAISDNVGRSDMIFTTQTLLRRLVLVAAVLGAWPLAALAQGVYETLSMQGLLGTWSSDCRQTASSDNPRTTFSAPRKGPGSLAEDRGPGVNRTVFVVRRVTDLSADRTLVVQYQPDKNALADTVLRMQDGKLRLVWQRESDSGLVLVHDGVIAATGKETRWLERCSRLH